ncbi:MAG TPA: SAM-dependent methyltransferase, partial [Burkholderiales bacterium]
PETLRRLTPKFLALTPGTRIVTNRFGIDGWEADETGRIGGESANCCTALLYVVPAHVAGTWHVSDGELALEQKFQIISGSLCSHGARTPIQNGRLLGNEMRFSAAGVDYVGSVTGDIIKGTMKGKADGAWFAIRA